MNVHCLRLKFETLEKLENGMKTDVNKLCTKGKQKTGDFFIFSFYLIFRRAFLIQCKAFYNY